jgi:cyclic pyranopterin monophosphate synthase
MPDLTHTDDEGRARMVDVSEKPASARRAVASAEVRMQPATAELIRSNGLKKGDVLSTARIAGIMAAKKTADLIPLCHPIPLTQVEVSITVGTDYVGITAECATIERTGVEMEALVAAGVAALTVYDMAKAVDRAMVVEQVRLETKTGGVRGDWSREEGPGFDQNGDTDG